MRKVLQQRFFKRPTLIVAEELLGKFLVRKVGKKQVAVMITEVEAYDGLKDKASHAHKGQTDRNTIMFGEAGYWYVYLVYGMHYMLNIVTGEKDYPAAILIRGVKDVSGPGKVTKQLSINMKQNETEAAFPNKSSSPKSNESSFPKIGLWIEDRGVKINKKDIKKTPRIGVEYAGPVWSKKLYRFVIKEERA